MRSLINNISLESDFLEIVAAVNQAESTLRYCGRHSQRTGWIELQWFLLGPEIESRLTSSNVVVKDKIILARWGNHGRFAMALGITK